MNFGNPGLAYSADQLQNRYLQFAHGQPPFRPPVNYLPQALQQVYPFIVTYTIDAVQAHAQDSPVRTYFYNLVSGNGWNNQAFLGLLDFTIRLIEIQLRSNNGSANQELTIKSCADKAVETSVAACVMSTPALQQRVVDANIQNTIVQIANEYAQLQQRIQQVYNNGGAAGNNWGTNQQNNNGWAQPNAGAGNGSWSVMGGNGGNVGFQGNNGGNVLASQGMTGATSAPAQRPNASFMGSPPAQAPAPVMAPAPQAPAPAVVSVGGYVMATSNNWKPTEDSKYAPAYNPGLVVLMYKVLDKGGLKPATKLKDENVSTMDWRDHILGTNATPFPVLGLDVAEENKKNVNPNSVERIGAPIPVKIRQDADTLYVGGDDTTAFSASGIGVTCLAVDDPSNLNISLVKGMVAESVVCTQDPRPFIEALQNCKRLSQVAELLQKQHQLLTGELRVSGGAASLLPNDASGVKTLTQINRRLTRAVNRFLALELAQYLQIDSFISELGELDTAIKDKGPSIYQCWETRAFNSVIAAIELAPAEWSQEAISSELETDALTAGRVFGENLFAIHFCEYSAYASVGLLSTQLQVQFPTKRISVALYETETPALFKITQALFKFAGELRDSKPQHYISRQLIKTLDDVVFCVYESPYQNEHYLIHQSSGQI